jgi:dihydrolipoamide dehydrogenase
MEYDVVVIGSGPGGYVCAIRCAQLGLKTAIVEKYKTLGGTCLNVGCIPSKALLDSSERFHNTVHTHQNHGINVGKVTLDFKKMMDRVQSKVVAPTCEGVNYLMKKNKIDRFEGVGSFVDAHTVKVTGKKEETLKAKNIVIATGSKPASLPGIEIDKKRVITSTEALVLSELPKKMAVIGGGVIGLELGSVYARLGTEVSIIEYADRIIPSMDKDLGKELQKALKEEGLIFHLSSAVQSVTTKGKKVNLIVKNLKKNEEFTLDADYCLVSVGRSAYTKGLGLENIGLELDQRGRVEVNENLQTKHSHIYGIGDVVKGMMLAHKAEEEGTFVAEVIAGQKPHIDYNLIPGVVYTHPEVAAVGKSEEDLKSAGIAYKKGVFSYKALGRAKASDENFGFVKVLADQKSDEILGVHMVGARTADMIAEAVVAMEFRASAEDIARISHAHPTYTESFKEACLAATENRAIHS